MEGVKMSCKCDTINLVNDNNIIVVSHADGRDGKSAYQQAVEGGYTGTEQEFNLNLKILADIDQVKKNLVSAIEYKGGVSSVDKSFQEIAENIREIPNFNTNGYEYIDDFYKPTNLSEAYFNRYFLKSVVDNYLEEISGYYIFYGCSFLQSAQFPNLVTISGNGLFHNCTSLQKVELPNLVTISNANTFHNCTSLQKVELPNLVTISNANTFHSCTSLQKVELPNLVSIIVPSSNGTFAHCASLQNVQLPNLVRANGTGMFVSCGKLQSVQFGTLIQYNENLATDKPNLRNITIGQNTNIDLPFEKWTATNVIAEGQSGIDELNNNLRTNLLEKLYDHSTDGQTRTLRLGWLAHVTQENIDYSNLKGWTLTT